MFDGSVLLQMSISANPTTPIEPAYDFVAIQTALNGLATTATDFTITVAVLTVTAVFTIHGAYELGLRSRVNRILFAIWYIRGKNTEQRIWKENKKRRKFKPKIFDDKDMLSLFDVNPISHWNIYIRIFSFIHNILIVPNKLMSIFIGKRFVLASQYLPAVNFSLHYQQFCSQIDLLVQNELIISEERSFLAIEGDPKTESDSQKDQRVLIRAWPQMVDNLQTFMGTWWIRINYLLTGMVIFCMIFVLTHGMQQKIINNIALLSVGVISTLVSPLIQRPIERLLPRR